MFSLAPCLYNKISKITVGVLISISFGCSNQMTPAITVSPKHFKVELPFILNGRGIIINTYWGTKKKHHVLCLDNYSPSWIKSSAIQYDKSFTKDNDVSFKTSTADGSPIQGDIGICDSLAFANIVFTKIPFYVMPGNSNENKNDDGVFGLDMMSKGIWKIDFKNSYLTFTSDIDSLQEISQAEIFPSTFNEQSIKTDVAFGNNIVKTMAIDLGFNGDFLLPLTEFDKLSNRSKAVTDSARLSTPGSAGTVNSLLIFDTVNINHSWFHALVSSNKTVKEQLIGLLFFRRFDFIILDFINKRIYLPKKVW